MARAQARGGNPAGIADSLERLAALYVEEKKYERAIDRARESMEVDRKPSDYALKLMGISAERLGALDRAEKYYREALAVDPGDATHPFNLSLLLNRQDRTREALELAEEAFRLCPAEGVYRGWRAIVLRRFGCDGEVLVELQRAALDLDALPSRDAWREYWRGRVRPGAGGPGVEGAAERRGFRRVGAGVRRVAAAGPAGRAGAEGVVKGEPSWRTAVTEAEGARRHVAQASEALERLAREVAALREWGDSMAGLGLARRLCEGGDGGVLTALVVASSDDSSPVASRAAADALLERLTGALGLSPIAQRGELLALSAEELGEFDVRGVRSGAVTDDRGLYRVVRSGWWLGSHVVDRPLLEPVRR